MADIDLEGLLWEILGEGFPGFPIYSWLALDKVGSPLEQYKDKNEIASFSLSLTNYKLLLSNDGLVIQDQKTGVEKKYSTASLQRLYQNLLDQLPPFAENPPDFFGPDEIFHMPGRRLTEQERAEYLRRLNSTDPSEFGD